MTACAWCGHPAWRREHAPFCPTVDASWMRFLNPLPVFVPEECVVDGCVRLHHARGFCTTHYSQWYRGDRELSAA